MANTTFTGPVISQNGFQGDLTGDITGDITGDVTGDVTGDLTGDVLGAALTTGAGAGITAGVGTVFSSEITKVGKVITTHIFIDLTGLSSSTTLNDIIGVDDAADSHLGQILLAECGQIFGGTMTCLEVPTTGVADIDLNASSASTGAEDADVTGLADHVALLSAGGAWTLRQTQSLTAWPDATSDYLYLSVGVAGTPGTYDAGQFLIELLGYEA